MSYFYCLYNASDEELPFRARAMYMYLRDRTGAAENCWPSVRRIAADMNLSTSTVKRALNDLVRVGLLEKNPRYRDNGSRTSNLLKLKK